MSFRYRIVTNYATTCHHSADCPVADYTAIAVYDNAGCVAAGYNSASCDLGGTATLAEEEEEFYHCITDNPDADYSDAECADDPDADCEEYANADCAKFPDADCANYSMLTVQITLMRHQLATAKT